jgi:hypothetical protein
MKRKQKREQQRASARELDAQMPPDMHSEDYLRRHLDVWARKILAAKEAMKRRVRR